jgi:peptidoglycan/xylan/chitin deacetylase (PgdA/CDA1 family)
VSILIPVLLYHSVSERPPPNGSWGAVSPSLFASHVDAIVASGREAIGVTTLAAMLRAERLSKRQVAITFDDGYGDTLQAVELLCSRGIGSTVYVTTGQVGAPGWLSEQELANLAQLPGVEVGSHGARHERLDELQHGELVSELRGSKSQLEQLIGKHVDSFAYPHGAYDRRVRAAVIAEGYRSAAAVKNAVSHSGDDPYAIARFTVTDATSSDRIVDVLDGKGVPLAWSRERLRTRAYRSARRHRRRLLGART